MSDHDYEEAFEETKREQRAARKQARKKDRSKYKKTDRDKHKRLLREDRERKLAKKNLLRGRVLSITPDEIVVECEGELYSCTLRGELKKEISTDKNLIALGDFALIEPEEKGIVDIEERNSVLSRQEHLRRRKQQVLAANLDQVLITASVGKPPLKPSLVDRYIIATFKGNMSPIIVINKIDLLEKGSLEQKEFETFCTTYQALKIPVLAVSAETEEGIEKLKKQMQGKASVFSGQSGVGKSSLINTMTGLTIPVGEVVEKTRKGVHTTTQAHLVPLEFGGWCIDTPGIRSFGIWELTKEDLFAYFPEIASFSQECKFPNCTHTHEPHCAVKQALEEEKLSQMRFNSYCKLLNETL
ncbi:MAG: putative ribosome biogenesis GTPase RsgA [Chlamydiae bacterium]|nr:putative ribosome biogenesis GTPase RsgA [Chlamydiota bacterium]